MMKMNTSDVLIIGGGAIGVCSAYYLAKKGVSVSLCDMKGVASGCSEANAGLIVPSYIIPLANSGAFSQGIRWMMHSDSPFYIKPQLDFSLLRWIWRFWKASKGPQVEKGMRTLKGLSYASSALFEALIREESIQCNYRKDGWLFVYRTKKGFLAGREEAHLLESHGVQAKVLKADETLEMEPTLLPGIAGAVHYPEDAHLDPAAFVCGLADRLKDKGVAVLEQTEVTGFEAHSGTIKSVRTTQGDFHPRQVIVAAGSWSPGILRFVKRRLPVQPAKGYSITLEKPGNCPKIPLYLGESKVAVTPLEKTLRLGGTLELTGMDFSIKKRRVDAVKSASREYLGQIEGLDEGAFWSGLRPCSPDGLPVISRVSGYSNLYVATGHGMLGISLAPVTGELISQLVIGQTPDIDMTPFSADRF
ncbi:MAG: FAD-dependent oxidoreductase [Candidatus Aminicenantes bacterium]|nr:FAD-dependent oxidoreductase [Candidatus Aminicenantes bacterium]